jgi:hypothetical protein
VAKKDQLRLDRASDQAIETLPAEMRGSLELRHSSGTNGSAPRRDA